MPLGDQVEDRIVAVMKRFGYTGSDARTYIALLQQHPATGYELAARGDVPRSAIYGVLKRLQQSGLVNAIPGKPARYAPMPPERLVAHLETRFNQDLSDFQEAVAQVVETQIDAVTWTVTGYESVLAEATRLIDTATSRIVCSIWRHEADRLASVLKRATERGVHVTLFSFTELPRLGAQCFSYGIASEELEQHWSRRMILATDNNQVLIGSTEGSRLDRALISDESVLVETAVANLVLDITLFGERCHVDTSAAVEGLTSRLAPIETLLNKAPA